MEIELLFNVENFPLEQDAKIFWTEKDGEGFKFFKDKAKEVLLYLGKGDTFEFEAYINGSYGRDIL